jgi:hypothetical protein
MDIILSTVWIAIQPIMPSLLGIVITLIVAQVAVAARKLFKIDIEARHREALHTALETAAQLALDRKLTAQSAINLIIGYVQQSVPDAIKALKPNETVLENLARAKLAKAGK